MDFVKLWLAEAPSAEAARYRARALRAFGRWSAANEGPAWPWAASVPLAATPPKPPPTATSEHYTRALAAAKSLRDRTVIELLRASGVLVSELARVRVDDEDMLGGNITVPKAKAGRPSQRPL